MLLETATINDAVSKVNANYSATDARVVKVLPGYGRDTNPGTRYAHCDDSDLIIDVEYTAPDNGATYRAMFAVLDGSLVLWMD